MHDVGQTSLENNLAAQRTRFVAAIILSTMGKKVKWIC
jgi:hypothetical protein